MPVNNLCDRSQTLHGWKITLVQPTHNVPSNTFQYNIVRVERPPTSRQISNILICLCPDITNEERKALLASCSCTVFYSNSTRETSSNCSVQNTITCSEPNPAECKGLKFNDIPHRTGGVAQERIVLNFTLTKPLPIGPVNIGFRAGPPATSGVWEGICGPVCDPITPPTRGIML